MTLTPAQRTTVRNWIAASFASAPLTVDDSAPIADALNATAAGPFVVWRSFVSLASVTENGFVWTEVDGLTISKARIWEWMTAQPHSRYGVPGFVPAKANVRAGLAEVWAANSTTRANLLAAAKRNATVLEKLLATTPGTGTTADPATPGVGGDGWFVEGAITPAEVYAIRAES